MHFGPFGMSNCQVKIVYGFPSWCVYIRSSREELISGIIQEIRHQIFTQYNRTALLIANTNSSQKEANEALRQLGFESSPWIKGAVHPDSGCRVWYLRVQDFLKREQEKNESSKNASS